ASFVAQLPDAAARPDVVVRALWDLAWLGLVTNDTFAPLRTIGRTSRGPRGRFTLPSGGRWSTLASVLGATPAETVRAHTRALMLLERYGVVSREAAAAESLAGGFASVSGVLRAMEESGKIRRGHFVDGLQGAQFAHAAAVDRLRAARDADGDAAGPPVVVLSAIDPANPYGALLPWPTEGARRAAGAKVVLAHGAPVFFVERGGKKLRLLAAVDDALLPAALAALRRIAAARRHRQLRIEEVDGVPALHSPHAPLLERGGFRVEPGALVLSADD
ncbi:MAG TPA: DEAD/DEAH box helicase, partial [Polyangia bacterium]